MAAAVSELLTGWCLFGLALMVRGASRGPAAPAMIPLLSASPTGVLVFRLRSLAVTVLGSRSGSSLGLSYQLLRQRVLPRSSQQRWGRRGRRNPQLKGQGCLAFL